jgi:DNA-binding MarR family transcriptional regulator
MQHEMSDSKSRYIDAAGAAGDLAGDMMPDRDSAKQELLADDRFDRHILRSLRMIIRAVDLYSQKLKARYQITGPQLTCLLTIAESGPLTATRIASHVQLSASTVVGILDRLEVRGLIQRVRDQGDRRLVNVTATEKGLELANNAPSPLQDGLANALGKLNKLEQATIALALRRIVDLMEAGDFDTSPILETGSAAGDEPGENSTG